MAESDSEFRCSYCGAEKREAARFCYSCGNKHAKPVAPLQDFSKKPDCKHPDLKTMVSGRLYCLSCGNYISSLTGFPQPAPVVANGEHQVPRFTNGQKVAALSALGGLAIIAVIVASSGGESSSQGTSKTQRTGHWVQNCIGTWVPNPNFDPYWQSDGTGGQGGTSQPNVYQRQCAQVFVQGP